MDNLTVYLNVKQSVSAYIKYIWQQFCLNKGIPYSWAKLPEDARLVISSASEEASILMDTENFHLLSQKSFAHWDAFFQNPIAAVNGKPDYWFTAFYLMAAIQEYGNPEADNLGRFPYKASYQAHFKNATVNLVQLCFDLIVDTTPQLKEYITIHARKSGFLLTHDIDAIYHGWKEDGKYLLTTGKPLHFIKLAFLAAIHKPHWFNIDKILSLEKRYGFRSVFYWIVEKGFENGLPNADYRFTDHKIAAAIQRVEQAGSENGLHKSLTTRTLKSEWDEMKAHYPSAFGHRYHFLKFNWHQACNAIVDAGITFDTSLGFAETIGFRNSYGLPYRPFDPSTGNTFHFVELPLAIMDRTIQQYMKLPVEEAARQVIGFLEDNKSNAVFSILWHNAFFENFKYNGYPALYIKLLEYFYASDFVCYTQQELVHNYLTSVIEE